MVFSGAQNHLQVIEEIYIGNLAPGSSTEVKIPIQMPARFPCNEDRFVLQFEVRHSYQT